MVTIYPSGIKGTTGRDPHKQTQKITDASNACNGTTSLASWGEYTPSLCAGGLNKYCNTVTTKSGSFEKPEVIQTTGWNIDKNISNDAIINKITVKYAYALAQYSGSGRGHIVDAPVISFKKKSNNKVIANKTGHLPSDVWNMRKGSLPEYSVTFTTTPTTIKDLKNSYLTFDIGRNIASEFCRVLLQYIKLEISYTNPAPKYIKYNLSANLNSTTRINSSYHYSCNIKSNNPYPKEVQFCLEVPIDTTLSNIKGGLKYSKKYDNYTLYKAPITNSKNKEISFDAKTSSAGTKKYRAYLSSYGNNEISKNITVQKPSISFKITPQVKIGENGTFNTPNTYTYMEGDCTVKFLAELGRNMEVLNGQFNTMTIKTTGFNLNWTSNEKDNIINKTPNSITISGKKGNIQVQSEEYTFNRNGNYTITTTYEDTETNESETVTYVFKITSPPLKKEVFKLRLEDGSDVQYNSLIFAKGDDLTIPLTSKEEDITLLQDNNFNIIGETKRIPTNEAEYITFDITLNDNKEEESITKNVLCRIEAINEKGENCDNIIIGTDSSGELLDSNNNQYCLIKELSNKKHNKVKLIIQSNTEQNCTIKLRPYNYSLYDTEWIASKVVFKDIPNIKLHIDSDDSNDIDVDDYITLNYYIENLSDIDGENLKFHIKEPLEFQADSIKPFDTGNENGEDTVFFNEKTRMITFKYLPAHSKKYVFSIQYQAKRKGIYNFDINTIDNNNVIDDDQNKNQYTYKILVGVSGDVSVNTYVTKNRPYVNEIIDLTIEVENKFKHQNNLRFDIKDIGDYNPEQHTTHYDIEFINCKKGEFYPNEEENNTLGYWELTNVPANTKHKLTLSLRPKKSGIHNLNINYINQSSQIDEEIQSFYNHIQVLEPKKQINFNVHQAVIDDDIECANIEDLIEICDSDYITLGDDIYYIFEITNNSVKELAQNINIYGRVPKSFIEEDIKCYTQGYKPIINSSNGLLNIQANRIEGCSTLKFFIKLTPTEIGEYYINFMLATKTADVFHKQFHLIVDTELKTKEIEHEINIYNFEKTNRYYRYEIDNNGEIFKFFNKGDKSVRPIETEPYHISLVERFKGNNLKTIINNIKENSKYVDPIFLRIGNNKLADKGYELYPDGFIRRFGLLKSEVFHYSNQLPIITNLGEKAFRWNIDSWNTKVWAGYPYENGVFDLTIDYNKIPSNFNVLEVDNPINKLQNIVNKTKPYGTHGICYYSSTSKLKFKIDIEEISNSISNSIDMALTFKDIKLTTMFTRHDGSIGIFFETINLDTKMDYEMIYDFIINQSENDYYSTKVDAEVDDILIYDNKIEKIYIEDCTDIVRNLYSINNNTQGIDITFPYKKFPSSPNDDVYPYLYDYQFMNCINNCEDNQFIGYSIDYKDNNIKLGYKREDINDFEGFVLELNGNEINKRKNDKKTITFSLGTQFIQEDENKIIHFWGSINNEEYYHIGFIEFTDKTISMSSVSNSMLRGMPQESPYTAYIEFFNTGVDNCQVTHKWYTKKDIQGETVTRTIPIVFKITDQIKEKTYIHNEVREIGSKKWQYLKNINKDEKYALFEYDSNIDKECKDKKTNVPVLAFKYDSDFNRENEIIDIDFTIEAQSNKDNFIEDVNINVLKDGDYYYPTNQLSSKIYYPQNISNTTKDLVTKYIISQPNITICTECLSTFLGYYDECPHCKSFNVHHEHKVQPVTICESCNNVAQGTYDYCPRCLSHDISNVDVDYNKTYCNHCNETFDGYYNHCPKCFKSDGIIYLDNKKEVYNLYNNRQNIKPITIKTYKNEVNVFNINIPFNKESKDLLDLKSLLLNVHYTNNNYQEYYYCESCGTGGIGHFNICPKCNNRNVVNKNIKPTHFNVYIKNGKEIQKIDLTQNNEKDNTIKNGSSVASINILESAKDINTDSFDISFYITNPYLDENIETITKIPIDDKYIDIILSKLNCFDLSIDNLTVESVFKDNNDWLNLNSLTGNDHTGLKYEVQNHETSSEPLKFFDFNIPKDKYKHAYLQIKGICKNLGNYGMVLKFNTDKAYEKEINNISNTIFDYEIDLIDIVKGDLSNLQMEIKFTGLNNIDEIIITDCNILMQKIKNNFTDIQMEPSQLSYQNYNNTYIIKSNDMWGLKNTEPYYLSGRQLESNLLCYLDFGNISSLEYIRLYNIYMTIYYKTKTGQITTGTINILKDENLEQYINGDVTRENGEIWGAIKDNEEALNNLESQEINIDSNGEILNFIPLYTTISQSFIYTETNIDRISINYHGKRGYPSDIINIYLFNDYNDRPNNIIAQNKIIMPNNESVINIDFDVNGLNQNEKYWIVIEDTNANENNYHRFNYNSNSIGTLIIGDNTTTKQALSFAIYSSIEKQSYYKMPVEWTVSVPIQETEYESDENEKYTDIEYKINNTLYRYNTNKENNVYLSNIIIKNGHYYKDEVE